jgi:hypothetical protein
MVDKLILALSALSDIYNFGKILAISGKDGGSSWNPEDINNPVGVGYALDSSVEDPALLDYVYNGQLRIAVLKITSAPPSQPSNPSSFTILEPSNMNITDWSKAVVENVSLQYGGTNVATNPHGMAQVKDWLHIVDYDSQKIVVVGAGEFDGMTSGQGNTIDIAPYDMGPGTAANLPATAKGKAIIAMKDKYTGKFYLFVLYIDFDPLKPEGQQHQASILVKLELTFDPQHPTNPPTITYAGQVEMGKNGQEIIPGFIPDATEDTEATGDTDVTGTIHLFVPALGGRQQQGASNGTDSNIMSVPAFSDWLDEQPEPITHITGVGQSPEQNPDYYDIHALGVSSREDGNAVFYIMTACFLPNWKGFDYRIYKSTVEKIYAAGTSGTPPVTPVTLADIAEGSDATAEIVDEGRVYSTAEPGVPYGIYYLNLLLQNADTPEGERLYVFLGSELLVTGAAHYKARALVFGDGEGDGHIGGKNVNSAILLAETIQQFEDDKSLKRGVRAIRIAVSGEEEEQEEE